MNEPHPPSELPRQPDERRALGARGEDAACRHLERLGFAILARNVRTRRGEIDVIAFNRFVLAFVEVKTLRARGLTGECEARAATAPPREGKPLIGPLDGLRWRQRHRLRQLATAWLCESGRGLRATEIRFDAIGVVFDRGDRLVCLEHVEGAW